MWYEPPWLIILFSALYTAPTTSWMVLMVEWPYLKSITRVKGHQQIQWYSQLHLHHCVRSIFLMTLPAACRICQILEIGKDEGALGTYFALEIRTREPTFQVQKKTLCERLVLNTLVWILWFTCVTTLEHRQDLALSCCTRIARHESVLFRWRKLI